jgi:hypothetical protein
MTYLPVSEKTPALIENLKPENKTLEEWLEEIFEKLKEKKDFQNIQIQFIKKLPHYLKNTFKKYVKF